MLDATLRDRARGLLTASGRSNVPPFMVMDVMAAAARIEAAGGHVIHMEVGQPSASAPKPAIAAAHAALELGRIDYTSALGIPSLRARIARHYRDTYGCAVDAERIVITTGSSGAFILGFLAMFEPGDRVAVTVPGYPPYRHILTALGCEPVLIETSSETRHALTGEALLAAHRKTPLKGVLVGSPANPTGTMMSREALTGLMAAAESAGIRFISDEIYHGLDYAFPAVTAAELSPNALVINSFSKYFCMTGWRVGWMVVPEPLVRPIERLQQNLSISVPTLSQIAAEAAFEGRAEMEAIKRGYQENRRILIDGLPQAGLDSFLPADGAFYLYADVSKFTSDSFAFAGADAGEGAMSRRRPGSTSIRFMAASSFVFPTRVPPTRCAKPSRASRSGSDSGGDTSVRHQSNTRANQEIFLSITSTPGLVAVRHSPLAAIVWPQPAAGISLVLRSVMLIALGTALLTLSAKVNLPLPFVPMTLQTLVVLVIGAVYGWRLGCATIIAYLAEGAMGLPVFAGPVGGLAPLMGPTAGYLAGFVAAAFVTGWLSERGWDRSVPLLFVAMALGHIIILAAGFGWLARHETRRREGMAGRDRAVPRGILGQECPRRGAGAGEQALARSSRLTAGGRRQRH